MQSKFSALSWTKFKKPGWRCLFTYKLLKDIYFVKIERLMRLLIRLQVVMLWIYLSLTIIDPFESFLFVDDDYYYCICILYNFWVPRNPLIKDRQSTKNSRSIIYLCHVFLFSLTPNTSLNTHKMLICAYKSNFSWLAPQKNSKE